MTNYFYNLPLELQQKIYFQVLKQELLKCQLKPWTISELPNSLKMQVALQDLLKEDIRLRLRTRRIYTLKQDIRTVR